MESPDNFQPNSKTVWLPGRKLGLRLGGSDFQQLLEAAELDGLHVQLGQSLLHEAVVLDLRLEPDKLQRRLGHLEDRKVEGLGHLFDALHHLPVGDLGAGLLELWQLDGDVEPGDRLEVEALGSKEVQGIVGVVTALNDAHLGLSGTCKRCSPNPGPVLGRKVKRKRFP